MRLSEIYIKWKTRDPDEIPLFAGLNTDRISGGREFSAGNMYYANLFGAESAPNVRYLNAAGAH